MRDVENGILWLRKSAEHGYWQARYLLGCCYADGVVIQQNHEEAVRLFRIVAEENVPEAMFRLGLCYHEGKGVSQDNKQAVFWIQKAADCGAGYDEAKEWLEQHETT